MANPFADFAATPQSYGTTGAAITPNDSADLDPVAKAVVVTSIAGGTTLKVLPSGNGDSGWVTFAGVAVGFVPPYQVRRVHTDTNCSVASVSG